MTHDPAGRPTGILAPDPAMRPPTGAMPPADDGQLVLDAHMRIAAVARPLDPAVPAWPGRLRALIGARAPAPPPMAPPGLRLYAIGDVHGRLDLLDAMLHAIRADHEQRGGAARAEVVLLGDLIDRGPDSAGVVAALMAPPDWAGFTILRGNHEQAMLAALAGDAAQAELWLAHGGIAALRSWGARERLLRLGGTAELVAEARRTIPPAVLAWLAARPLSARRGDYFLVHAGVRPGVPLDQQAAEDALWIRAPFLRSRADHGAVVVHGHTISERVETRANRIGIDTGAHRTGRLTALALEGAERRTLQT